MNTKQTKITVDYIDESTVKTKFCGNCGWYLKYGKCGIVKGSVKYSGYCKLWGTKKFTKAQLKQAIDFLKRRNG